MNWSRAATAIVGAFILALIVYEFWALLDHNHRTPPITHLVVRYVPWWISLPFFTWLPVHFALRYFNPDYLKNL